MQRTFMRREDAMHKLYVLAIAIVCMQISSMPPRVVTASTATPTAKPTVADEALTIVTERIDNMFVFVAESFLNFIRDREDRDREPKFDLIKQVPLSFFNFIAGREGNSSDQDESGIGHVLVKQLISFMDDDVPLQRNDAAPKPLTYDNVDVLQFVCNSFFHYITNTEGDNHAKNKNIMEHVINMVFL